MKLFERLSAIEQLEKIEKTPYAVKRTFGEIQIYGSQVGVLGSDSNDFVSLAEFREALQILVEQAGGTVKWPKQEKKT